MSDVLYLLSLPELLSRITPLLSHGMLSFMIADERHVGDKRDERTIQMRVKQYKTAAIIIGKLRKAMFKAQFAEQAEVNYGSEILSDLVEELRKRSSALCIGFTLGDSIDIQCSFMGDKEHWEMLVEGLEENIWADPVTFGEMT
jgi:hypothetical protein